MNNKLHFLFAFVFSALFSAQSLQLSLPFHANKQAIILELNGIRKDTLAVLPLDKNGKATFNYKDKKQFTGIVELTIKGNGLVNYPMVLSLKENSTLTGKEEYLHSQNTTLQNSPENTQMQRWFTQYSLFQQKKGLNMELSRLYPEKSEFANTLEKERNLIEKNNKALRDSIDRSTTYAGKYLQFRIAQEEILPRVYDGKDGKTKVRNYFTNLDFEALYGSSMWYPIINSTIDVYIKEGPFYEQYGSDITGILKKVKNDKVYADLAEAAITITEKFSWGKDQQTIVDFLVADKRIKNPQGKLRNLLALQNIKVGSKAPDLFFTLEVGDEKNHRHQIIQLPSSDLSDKYSLIIFYQSGCGPCENTMNMLKGNYELLQKKGIRFISISADTDEQIFKNTANSYPWNDKFCDLQGLRGINFQNYAVMGTPTMFLLDNSGKILAKMATVEELMKWYKGLGK